MAKIEVYLANEPAIALPAQDSELAGAEVIFNGYVRAQGERARLLGLDIEHYPAMTQQALQTIAAQTCERFQCERLTVMHRVGRVAAGELIVSLRVQAAHRRQAFDAAEFYMDYLKNSAPFWKKEISETGDGHWVEQKQSDRDAFSRWQAADD